MKKKLFIILIILIIVLFIFYFRPIKGNSLITEEYKNSSAYINNLYKSDEMFKHKLLDEREYYVYEALINASIKDIPNVTIKCKEPKCYNAMIPSYNAIYLDHPELISFKGMNQYRYNDYEVTYRNYSNLGTLKTYLATKRIERIMENLRNKTKDMNDKDKIIFVYNYVASHNYDRLMMTYRDNQSAYSFFSLFGGSSVCAGFAKASQIIFQNVGINSYLVMNDKHMWNYVEYEGKYYIFDATMGASYRNKENIHFYDGLGETTTGDIKGMYSEYYPEIQTDKLKDIFNL